ncbi:MAG: metal ABC transporter permease [Pseudomonadota bacterium]|nr:metal ABC transporter permease [Pseudomonadota bacterium]
MIEELLSPEFVQISLAPMLVGLLASLACALPGNFLLLRRQALIGDAISHVALPGIVAAFLATGGVAAWPMMIGAAAAALVAVALIEAIRRFGRVESGAAMGVVFTSLFALGVLLLERSDTAGVHLDVQHALYGNLESLVWFDAAGWGSVLDPAALAGLPPQAPRLAAVLAAAALLCALFWKELALSTFDPGHAAAVGLPTGLIGFGLVAVTAVAAVAAFDAVGSIIVIAMFVCPPAAARMMTDRLGRQVAWSLGFAAIASVLGYVLAGYGPGWIGRADAVSAAGMTATAAGTILALAAGFGPRRRRMGAPA